MSKIFDPGYYCEDDLKEEGFGKLGRNIKIAKNCTIIGINNISIGDNVRIDGFTSIIASGNGYITIGSFVHIGAYCILTGGEGIIMNDFCGLSHGVQIYSRTDDYSGNHLTNPTVPQNFTKINRGTVCLERHVIIGAGSVILPNIVIGEGSAVGALSLVNKNVAPWGIYFGCPAKKVKDRSKKLLELEKQLIDKK
ncbi:MAG: acyltransferase [Planctomycetes bacterium]|nr:acyltransferase [Planctomycetota bacterium]